MVNETTRGLQSSTTLQEVCKQYTIEAPFFSDFNDLMRRMSYEVDINYSLKMVLSLTDKRL